MTRSLVLLITAAISCIMGFVTQYHLVGGEGFSWPREIYMGIVQPGADLCAIPTLMLVWVYSARTRGEKMGGLLLFVLARLSAYMTQLVDYLCSKEESGITGVAGAIWCLGWVVFAQNATFYMNN